MDDLQDLVAENRALESETAVLQEELSIAEEARRLWLCRNMPEGIRLRKIIEDSLADLPLLHDFHELHLSARSEHCAYNWRRDYGEWPTFWNLTDRIAVERRISHDEASQLLGDTVSDPSDESCLWAVPGDIMEALMNDGVCRWEKYVPGVINADIGGWRLYVSPLGIEKFKCAERYRLTATCLRKLLS